VNNNNGYYCNSPENDGVDYTSVQECANNAYAGCNSEWKCSDSIRGYRCDIRNDQDQNQNQE
jgi:hypothetical protein